MHPGDAWQMRIGCPSHAICVSTHEKCVNVNTAGIDHYLYFELYCFTGSFDLFPRSVQKDRSSLVMATHFIQKCSPTLGNSELLLPLQSCFLLSPEDGTTKNVFIITDGHLNNETAVMKLVRDSNSKNVRVFLLGVR